MKRTWLDALHHWSKLSRYHRFNLSSKSHWGADTTDIQLIYDTMSENVPIGVSIGECADEVDTKFFYPYEIADDFGNTVRSDFSADVIDSFGSLVIESNNYYYDKWRMWLYGFNVGEDFNKMIPFAFEKFYEHFSDKPGVVLFDYDKFMME